MQKVFHIAVDIPQKGESFEERLFNDVVAEISVEEAIGAAMNKTPYAYVILDDDVDKSNVGAYIEAAGKAELLKALHAVKKHHDELMQSVNGQGVALELLHIIGIAERALCAKEDDNNG